MSSPHDRPSFPRRALAAMPRAVALLALTATGLDAQSTLQIEPALLAREWPASWVAAPGAPPHEAGVYHFRRDFSVDAVPEQFVVHVSADNRYRLFVNGVSVAKGPARGDLMNWRFETVDLAPWLRPGRNVVAAVVWNWGEHRPVAQISHRTGFLVQGDGEPESMLNTGAGWRVLRNTAYSFTPVVGPDANGYYVASPGEVVDARSYPWGWESPEHDDSAWQHARPIVVRAEAAVGALPRGAHQWGEGGEWQLVPRNIPAMEETPIRMASVRRSMGVRVDPAFLLGTAELRVPARTRATLLLDQDHLTNAYLVVEASGGAGGTMSVTYAEALFDADGRKGNRNEVEGKTIRGVRDRISFDGGDRRRFQSLWQRTFRYVQLDVETAAEPLVLHDLHGIYTAYPFEERAAFESDRAWLADVWAINWRMLRLSAFETFWDTPYYEQLQYVGDTRIESLLSLYTAGDDRLMRNAILHFDQSRTPEGITASRYPSALPQYIPPFSLWWIAMIHDHWMHRDDPAFVASFVPGIRGVLAWFERHVDGTGMLGPMPWWSFLDWHPAYPRGIPPGALDGNSTAITLQFAYVLMLAAELEDAVGQPAEGARYRSLAHGLRTAARDHAWDERRGLFADSPEKRVFSQQTNALAVLAGAVPSDQRRPLIVRVLEDGSLVQASFYFRFYVDEAMRLAGLADRYLERLEPWREMIRIGLTTTPENPEPTRSDSHAWSAHPNYGFLATVLGVRPAEPGFRSVRIQPALGPLRRAAGAVPHPLGPIEVRLARGDGRSLTGTVTLPAGLHGVIAWGGQEIALRPGTQTVELTGHPNPTSFPRSRGNSASACGFGTAPRTPQPNAPVARTAQRRSIDGTGEVRSCVPTNRSGTSRSPARRTLLPARGQNR
jgi:alpha-L-rhamnosidase